MSTKRDTHSSVDILVSSVCLRTAGLSTTHTAAAYKDDAEALKDPSSSHHPSQPQEQNDTKDVLEARQVHAHEGSHLWWLEVRRRGANPQTIQSCQQLLKFPWDTPSLNWQKTYVTISAELAVSCQKQRSCKSKIVKQSCEPPQQSYLDQLLHYRQLQCSLLSRSTVLSLPDDESGKTEHI